MTEIKAEPVRIGVRIAVPGCKPLRSSSWLAESWRGTAMGMLSLRSVPDQIASQSRISEGVRRLLVFVGLELRLDRTKQRLLLVVGGRHANASQWEAERLC
jgi:hypothetical protein